MAAQATPIRIGWLDAARGAAVIAMVTYHFVWDLSALAFIDPGFAGSAGFRRLGATIAGTFLLIAGMALVLAREAAPDAAAFRAKFLKRLMILVAAAALVSLGTWFAMGDRFVRFGILHCIAAASLIALPFLRLPAVAALAGAAALLILPWLIDLPAFFHPALLWTGLSWRVPAMVDYVPVFPFAGMTLLGVAAAKLMRPSEAAAPGWLTLLGRWSLPIYLIHQPILYGGLFLLAAATATGPSPSASPTADRDTMEFRVNCRRSCASQGNDTAYCERYCGCMETDMKASDLWRRAMSSTEISTVQADLAPVIQACMARARQP
jgi:uncharacterized membrane protein